MKPQHYSLRLRQLPSLQKQQQNQVSLVGKQLIFQFIATLPVLLRNPEEK